MTETRDTASRWWPRRRLRLLVLIGILAALVVMVGLDFWTARMVDTEIARLESRYGSLASYAGQQPSVPAFDNRARLVRAAAALANHGAADPSEVRRSLGSFKKRSEPAPVPDDLRALVEANRLALRIADEARALDRAVWEASYDTGINTPPLLDLRTLSNVIYVATCLEIEAGRLDEASRTVASGLAVAASIRNEPALIAQLIRIAVGHEQFDAVEELITRAEPSKAALEDLARWLRENGEPHPIHVGLMGELKYGNAALTSLEGGRAVRIPAAGGPSWSGLTLRIGRPLLRLVLVRHLQQVAALIETQGGPRPLPSAPAAPTGWLDQRLSGSLAGLRRAMESGDLFMSALAATEIGVALRRHRLDRGAYPDGLSALVPEYLARLPIDPFTGRPPIYTRRDSGFTLTSQPGTVDPANHSALEWTVLR